MAASDSFRFDTGHPCLDLIATVGARFSDSPVERLHSPDRLRDWLAGAHLVPATAPVVVTAQWLPAFWDFRTLVYRMVREVMTGQRVTAAQVYALNAHLRAGAPTWQLSRARDGQLSLRVGTDADYRSFLSTLALGAATLLAGEDRHRLRECRADICGVIYLDYIHGRERIWCSTAICGNRERVARHRRRVATARAC